MWLFDQIWLKNTSVVEWESLCELSIVLIHVKSNLWQKKPADSFRRDLIAYNQDEFNSDLLLN